MQIVIDIPEEQIKKSLKESEYILEDEGIKGFVNIVMLYTNGRLEFVDVERREDFYSCNFTPLPKGHGALKDTDAICKDIISALGICDENYLLEAEKAVYKRIKNADTIIEADKEYEVEVVTRGNCMMCGKELDKGLFFCKECEAQPESGDTE